MERILKGIEHFERVVYPAHRQMFEDLAKGQNPEVFMITCSDSRVVPSLITQTMSGELFILRNAGNMLPESRDTGSGEWAAVEYAVEILKCPHIVVCGHSGCGAMTALLEGGYPRACRSIARWLANGRAVKKAVARESSRLDREAVLERAIQENVLVQLRRLRAHPRIARRVRNRELQLHGWVFDIGTGTTTSYNAAAGGFVNLLPAAAGSTA